MEGILQVYGGGRYVLPPLLSWDVTLTGGVPCDSFSLTCPYEAAMAEPLDKAWRLTLERNGTLLQAVVDESEIVQDEKGRILHLSGRGLAALLLDNESAAVEYSAPTLSEILRNHVSPYGIRWESFTELRGTASYAVASASSQWKALCAFTRYFGGFEPRFTPEGVLQPFPWRDDGKRLTIGVNTPVLSLRWKDKRYGVYTEVLVVDKVRRTTQSVKNQALLARGGSCRRVLYMPGRSTGTAMRYTGEYQIRQSKQGARLLTAVLPGCFAVKPGTVIRMERGDIGITGEFYLEEVAFSCDGKGETTTLRMRRLQE